MAVSCSPESGDADAGGVTSGGAVRRPGMSPSVMTTNCRARCEGVGRESVGVPLARRDSKAAVVEA